MKQKFIPLEKQSKQKQKEYHAVQRGDWGSINPVTKKVENGKAYNRKKSKQRWLEHEPCLDFFIFLEFVCSITENHTLYISFRNFIRPELLHRLPTID